MTVCLSVKTDTGTSTFQYLGNDPELWKSSVERALKEIYRGEYVGSAELDGAFYSVGAQAIRKARSRVQYPDFYVELERVMRQASLSQWTELDLSYFRHNSFVSAIRLIWGVLKEKLTLESAILDTLYAEGNGGLKVESIMGRLLAADVVARFAVVRDALGHLCKLCLVEHAHGQFSVRQGMLAK